jgi:putative membrane-bound dehydrogenase-like protein
MKVFVFLVLFLSIVSTNFLLAPKIADNKSHPTVDTLISPEEELKGFTLPEGFVIELVASERDGIINPVDLTFDDAGRLWTQTASMYPLDPFADIQWDDLLALMNDPEKQHNHPAFKRVHDLYEGKTKGVDKVLVISDLYNANEHPKTTVWADGLTIPMSILPYKDGAYVVQGSALFFLNDSSHRGRADQRIPMFTGFGFTDTHTMAHVLVRGPGGWIYFSHGALNKGNVSSFFSDVKVNIDYSKIARFSMDAKKMELVSAGLNNIWGFQLRANGQWYGTEANDLGYSIVPMEPGTGFPGIGGEHIRSYQPWMPELHKFRVGGTGISGLAFADDAAGSFPPEWKDVAILANPITNTINCVRIVRNADGSVKAEHLPDLLSSKDKSFRPVNIEFGPDGCLYVADWYDKIISHNEIPTTDPNRDKLMGRIWRIRHVSQKPVTVPDFYTMKSEALVGYLKSPSLWAKLAAWHQITDRPANETSNLIPAIVTLAGDESQDEVTRIHALWCLEGVKYYDAALMNALLVSNKDNLRREAIRSLAAFSLTPAQVAVLLKNAVEDPNAMVRSEVLRTLADVHKADAATIDILVRASKPWLPGNTMGGAYERSFERYLALKALEQYPDELYAYMQSSAASVNPATNLLWAIQALPQEKKEEQFLRIWPTAHITQLDEPTFIWLSKLLSNEKIYTMVKPLYENPANASNYIELALNNQSQVQSPQLASLLEAPVQQLLKSNSESTRQRALEAIGNLQIKTPRASIMALVNNHASDRTIDLAIHALENDLEANKTALQQIAQNKQFAFGVRVTALQSLAKADAAMAQKSLQQWIPSFTDEQKRSLVTSLSASKQGADLLTQLYNKKLIGNKAFTISSAERLFNADSGNTSAKKIFEVATKQAADEKKLFDSRLSKYMTIAEKKGGNTQKGKVIFQTTCLMCHKVGDKGQNIAPALDGSAARENKALLTAILDPDAAVEGGYAVYRVTKKDNSTMEGYLVHKDDAGTTLAFMGGAKIFIPAKTIKEQDFLQGRSFMPKGILNNFSDTQVADLLAYIRTLK